MRKPPSGKYCRGWIQVSNRVSKIDACTHQSTRQVPTLTNVPWCEVDHLDLIPTLHLQRLHGLFQSPLNRFERFHLAIIPHDTDPNLALLRRHLRSPRQFADYGIPFPGTRLLPENQTHKQVDISCRVRERSGSPEDTVTSGDVRLDSSHGETKSRGAETVETTVARRSAYRSTDVGYRTKLQQVFRGPG